MASSVSSLFNLGPGTNLDDFTARILRPSPQYLASCNAVVDRLVRFLQHNVPDVLRPSRVVKGGSLGKGTAVEGRSDIDLILFLSNYKEMQTLVRDMKQLLDLLEKYLGQHGECRVVGQSRHSVQVELSCHSNHSHDVDILPTVDVDVRNQYTKQVIYQQMRTSDSKAFYSACLTPLQLDFVAAMPTKVKDLIRLVKFWKKTNMQTNFRWPKSYLLELIVIHCWQQGGRKENFDLKKGLCAVLAALVNYRNLRGVWEVNFNRQYVQPREACYVYDPANPYNNVMTVCDVWDDVAQKARQLQESPLLRGVLCDRNHW